MNQPLMGLKKRDDPAPPLDLSVVGLGRHLVQGRISSFTAAGVIASFSGPEQLGLAVGDPADLLFRARHLDDPVATPSWVQQRDEESDRTMYGFGFLDPEALLDQLSIPLRFRANRRTAARVEPDPSQPVEVSMRVQPSARGVTVLLHDISPSGISVRVPRDVERSLVETRQLHLSLFLPGEADRLEAWGEIRHRTLIEGGVRYGLSLSGERTSGFARVQDRILQYVASRQRQIAARTWS